jgi:hypothetical protein
MQTMQALIKEAHKIAQLREASPEQSYYKDFDFAIEKLYSIAKKMNQAELIDQTKYQQLKIKISNVKLYFDSL